MSSPLAQQILAEYPDQGISEDRAGAAALVVRQVARVDGTDPNAPIRTQLARARRIYLENPDLRDYAHEFRKAYSLTEDESVHLFCLVTGPGW